MAAHQAPPSLGFSRQEHWSGVPFPSPMHYSENWTWSCSVVSDSERPCGLQPTGLLCLWDFPGKSTGVGCHCLLRIFRESYFVRKKFQSHNCQNHHSWIRGICGCSFPVRLWVRVEEHFGNFPLIPRVSAIKANDKTSSLWLWYKVESGSIIEWVGWN